MKLRTPGLAACATALALAALAPVARADTVAPCTEPMPAGDWATYGGPSGMGTNRQDAETALTTQTVAGLQEEWRVTTGYQSEPIVAGGCVFVANAGGVEAYDLDTGAQLWRSEEVDATGSFAVAVAEGQVHVNLPNGDRPKAAALDASTGELIWESPEILFYDYPAWQNASAVVHEGIHVLFTTGPDFDPNGRPGYALFDAATGELLRAQTSLPPEDIAAGYAGGGVWGTPSVDPVDDYLYVGTANPYSTDREHDYDNAVIKLDLDPSRSTFGTIVDSYKGMPDSVTGYDNPVCAATGTTVPPHFGGQQTCGQIDIDFGVGPALWRDTPDGPLHLAILQKSGVLHVVDAETMEPIWTKEVGTNSILTATGGNINRVAFDGETIYVHANPAILRALDKDDGAERWNVPMPEPITGGNLVYAHGVVYHTVSDNTEGYDAATGQRVWQGFAVPKQAGGGGSGQMASGTAVAGGYVVGNLAGQLTVWGLGS